MKLILCRRCQDVFKLDYVSRSCKCGECTGRYLEDGISAEYTGVNAVPIGFANSTLARAIANQPEDGSGEGFTAFVIPKVCPTMKHI